MTAQNNVNVMDQNRYYYLYGEVNEEMTKNFIPKLLEFEQSDFNRDIVVYVDSYGGEIHSFVTIHDMINLCNCDVATVCVGKAMSAGAMLLLSGQKGKRFITENSNVMIHQLLSGCCNNMKELEAHTNYNKELQNMIEKIILKNTKIKKTELKEMMTVSKFMSAKEALKYGIVDYIIKDKKELNKHIK